MNVLHKKEKALFFSLWIIATAVNIVSVFFSYFKDDAYTMLMAYRMLKGDHMFLEMWETHQTSAILPFLLMKLYTLLFGTTDGFAVWMHLWGCLIFLGISLLMISLLKKYIPMRTLQYMALLFWIIRPKWTNTPDFANMSVAFSALFWLMLVVYILEKKKGYLIIGVFASCFAIFAYPSNVLLIITALVLLWIFDRDNRAQSMSVLIFGNGVLFLSFYVWVCVYNQMSPLEVIYSLGNLIYSDSHAIYSYSGWAYFKFAVIGSIYCSLLAGLAFIICRITRKAFLKVYGLIIALMLPVGTMLLYSVYQKLGWYEWYYPYMMIIPVTIICGIVHARRSGLSEKVKIVYITGMAISCTVMLDTMLLTDLSIITIFGYGSLALISSLIPVCGEKEIRRDGFIFALCLFVVFATHQAVLGYDLAHGMNLNITKENYIRVGPEKWIATELGYCNKVKIGRQEWQENITANDAVLIAEEWNYDLTAYMYTDATISNCTVISTPIYVEKMLKKYWDLFPNRKPTVIAIPCYQGDECRSIPEWLSNYIDYNYEKCYTGVFWNFYREQ